MLKQVQDAIREVEGAKKQVNLLYKDSDLTHSLPEINSLFDRILTRMKYQGGVLSTDDTSNKKVPFPPITNFMGEEIKVSKPIDRNELNPKEAEKQKLRDDVQKLYDNIRELTPSQVLNAYVIPEHVTVVRGVAKWAGVKDFESREMNIAFIEDIQLAIEEKEEEKKKQALVDKSVLIEKVVTQEDIDADADLQKMKAKAGDTVITDAKGKRSIKKDPAK